MTEIGTLLDDALPALPAAQPDWDDVLARAGVRGPVPLVRRVLVVAAAALVVAGGAFAASNGLRALVFGRSGGIVLTAQLGHAGVVQVSARGLYIAHGRAIVVGRLRPVGSHRRGFPRTVAVHWQVDLRGSPTLVVLAVRGRTVATLCSPCADGAHGTLQFRPRVVQAVFAGRGTASLEQPHVAAPLRMKR